MYAEMRASLALPHVREAYRVYSRILRLATDQKTDFDTLHLGSLFAKLDYLSRQYHLTRDLVRNINDTRVRLRRLLALDDEELALSRLHDLKAICQLISVLYGEAVPTDLVRIFPADSRPVADKSVVADSMRLYVTRHEGSYLYGTCEELPDVEEVCVCYYYKSRDGLHDERYLLRYIQPGTQLNLVKPRLYNEVYYPELIILEPDYLVDITTVAGCFEEYAHDARLALLSKLRPNEDTEAIMLGNLAGQLLDEEVHSGPTQIPYAESYRTFVKGNAFKMLTTPIKTMREDGEKQKHNIQRALNEGLLKLVGQYDRTNVALEPSFICEMLGLQGRMDLLQLDYRVLIEQKSGKGKWYPGESFDKAPQVQPKHHVQTLLYQAILHYAHGLANGAVQLLLLYSKYNESLVGVTPAPELLKEAIRLRNQIAGNELTFCHGGMSQLVSLKTSELRQLQVRDTFWEKYSEPGLKSVLDPVQQASPLERAYFLRFMTFLANEHTLAKVGTKTKESSGFASKWHDSLEEKYQTGNIYDQLTLLSPAQDHQGKVEELVLAFTPGRGSEMSNFRPGDIVIAYQYPSNREPDARRTIVLRGSIVSITTDTLRIRLRSPQSDKHVLLSNNTGQDQVPVCWAVEHDFMESGYKALYSGMHAFLSAPKSRRNLLLMQREPEVDATRRVKGDYGRFDELATRVKQAKDFFLIIGPPGTGKTSYGMLYTLKEQLREEGSNVLITSFTNRAVDEVCGKLVEEGIDFLRIGSELSCSPEYRDHLLDARLAHVTSGREMRELVEQTRVVVGTTTSLSTNLQLFRLKQFDLAIIDEASQILEPHLMGLLSAKGEDKTPAIRKFVMIGDHKQLPAVVQQRPEMSAVSEPILQSIGLVDCRLSLFERLLTRYRHNPAVVYMLTRQGRMHRDIADFPNRMFYGGKLEVVPLAHQTEELPALASDGAFSREMLLTRRVSMVDVPVQEPVIADKVNVAEAERIADLVVSIYQKECACFDPLLTVGVIVPYRNQIAAVRNAIDARCVALGLEGEAMRQQLHDITIDTVERYQGSQRDYILYGFTVQRPYQLNFLANNTFEEDGMTIDRKLNVAMTRARKHLIMLGDVTVVSRNALFAQLIDYVRERGGLVSLRSQLCDEG